MKKKIYSNRPVLIIAGLAFLILTACRGEEEVEPAPIVRPVMTIILGASAGSDINYPGIIQGAQRSNLSFRVSGPLIEFPVKKGDWVDKGQILARIDPRDYRIALNEAKADYVESLADFSRHKELYERNAVSLADLDVRRARRDIAKARMDHAAAALSDTDLKAPYSGYVGLRFVENHQQVWAHQDILSLQDVSNVEIAVDIPEDLIAGAGLDRRKGEFSATFPTAPDRSFPLEIRETAAQADPQTLTYRVVFTMPQPEGINVLPGMTVRVHASGSAGADVEYSRFVIPSYAVFAAEDGTQRVWIVDQKENTVHQREVEVGSVTGEKGIEIREGVKPGEMIALTGVTLLREGMKVKPMNQEKINQEKRNE